MKIYIDELPKGCKLGCPYCYHEIKNTYYCAIQNKYIEFFGDDYFKREKDCPLQSLTDYTKQVRKEVLDGLAISLIAHFSKDAEFTTEEICDWLQTIKDQI